MAFSFTDIRYGGVMLERQSGVRISQCMIVKDEENNIKKALS